MYDKLISFLTLGVQSAFPLEFDIILESFFLSQYGKCMVVFWNQFGQEPINGILVWEVTEKKEVIAFYRDMFNAT